MSTLQPGWADSLGAVIGTGDAGKVEEATGVKRIFRHRIDMDRLRESARKGGLKGGKNKKGAKHGRSSGHGR